MWLCGGSVIESGLRSGEWREWKTMMLLMVIVDRFEWYERGVVIREDCGGRDGLVFVVKLFLKDNQKDRCR